MKIMRAGEHLLRGVSAATHVSVDQHAAQMNEEGGEEVGRISHLLHAQVTNGLGNLIRSPFALNLNILQKRLTYCI